MARTTHHPSTAVAALVGCLGLIAACGGSPNSSDAPEPAVAKPATSAESAGPVTVVAVPGQPVTLHLATNDNEDGAMSAPIKQFARLVDELSGGTLFIEPMWDAGPPDDTPLDGEYIAWDQFVARRVVSGEIELGLIPARAWDTEGITTFRALFTPFLIDSNELLTSVVSDEALTADLLAGLDGSGATGLALIPEGIRHLFSFGEPLDDPADFVGVTIRAPRSLTTYALFEALGASVDDVSGGEFETAVGNGSIAGAESSFDRAFTLPGSRPTATGNLALFPNVNSLVINDRALDALTADQRGILTEAATRTRLFMSDHLADVATAASDYCAAIGDVVIAHSDHITALAAATEPVIVELRRDARTAGLIDRIEHIKSDTPAAPEIGACTYDDDQSGSSTAPATDTIPVGTYVRTITAEDAEAVGVDPADVNDDLAAGGELELIYEFSANGQWTLRADFCGCGSVERGDFGNYEVDDQGRLVTISANTSSRGFKGVIDWTFEDGVLSLVMATGVMPDGTTRALDPMETLMTLGDYTAQT